VVGIGVDERRDIIVREEMRMNLTGVFVAPDYARRSHEIIVTVS
jgi:thioredoxin reductase